MRRFGLAVLGVVLVMVGTFIAVIGLALLTVVGPDGVVSAPATRVVAPGSAVTVDTARFDGGLPQALSFSEATVTVSGLDGQQVFLGAGRANDVLTYLAGSSYDVLVGADGRSAVIDQETVDGSSIPSRPAAQSFWTTQTMGTGEQSITVALGSGDQLVVAMNADGTTPVDLRWTTSVAAPWAFPVSIAAVSGGLAVVIVGAWCIARGTRRRERQDEATSGDATHESGAAAVVSNGSGDDDPHHLIDIRSPESPVTTAPSEWGAPIAPSDTVVPAQRAIAGTTGSAPSATAVTSLVTTPGDVELRLLGAPALSGAPGPDAPPREPRR